MDVSAHLSVFDPSKFKGTVGIIGLGSIGSAVALQLAKLGLNSKMELYDFDVVEGHNLPNQILYGQNDIGAAKVQAAAIRIGDLTDGIEPDYFHYKVEKKRDIVSTTHFFLCVDSMEARKSIFENCVYRNANINFFSDGRMAARHGMVYGFNPLDLRKAKTYRARLYPDSDVDSEREGGCTLTTSIGATAMTIACQMVWMFINHFTYEESGKTGEAPDEELFIQVDRLSVHSSFKL